MSNTMFAQTSLGAACGCQAVGSRPIAAITTKGTWTTLPASAYGKELQNSQNITLSCDTVWTLNEKLYIGPGSTLTIAPGTVIKSTDAGTNVAAARAIIIERGAKIIAPGVEDCPIIFTAIADPLDGTYSVNNKGKWGGILLCGTATNNLKLDGNGPFVPGQGGKMAVADGLGVLEGFASSYPQDQFGVAISQSGSTPAGYTALSGTYPSGSYTWSPAFATTNRNLSGTQTLVLASNASSALAALAAPVTITGAGIPAGTTATIVSGNASVTLSAAATADLNGGYYTFTSGATSIDAAPASVINNSSGSNVISITTTPLFSVLGLGISGTGIPNGTVIGSVSGNNLYLIDASGVPVALTANPTGNVTITGTYPTTTATAFQNISGSTPQGPVVFAVGTSGQLVNLLSPAPTSGQSFNDNDNSGVMTYVSIRHSGANLLVGSEINGLTLASVGRGTKIEHIEIVSCADDNIEIFGGTVDLKYCTTLFGNDDMFDYDLGWTGRAQFLFGMKADHPSGISPDNDNGFECDGDDGKTYATPISAPVIYNATVMGNAKSTNTADNTGMIGLCLKEFAAGEIRNSIFAGFKEGVRMTTVTTATATSGTRGRNVAVAFNGYPVNYKLGETVHNYLAGSTCTDSTGNGSLRLKVKCNTFVGNTTPVSMGATATTTLAKVNTQLAADGNLFTATVPGFNSSFAITTSNVVTTKNDATPNPALPLGAGCTQAPSDGFFEPANYRGAFSSVAGDNWLSDWSYSELLGSTLGVKACPTDLNGDGTTNTNDFLIFLPKYGTNCN